MGNFAHLMLNIISSASINAAAPVGIALVLLIFAAMLAKIHVSDILPFSRPVTLFFALAWGLIVGFTDNFGTSAAGYDNYLASQFGYSFMFSAAFSLSFFAALALYKSKARPVLLTLIFGATAWVIYVYYRAGAGFWFSAGPALILSSLILLTAPRRIDKSGLLQITTGNHTQQEIKYAAFIISRELLPAYFLIIFDSFSFANYPAQQEAAVFLRAGEMGLSTDTLSVSLGTFLYFVTLALLLASALSFFSYFANIRTMRRAADSAAGVTQETLRGAQKAADLQAMLDSK